LPVGFFAAAFFLAIYITSLRVMIQFSEVYSFSI